jgi:hypothetical protein
MLVHWFCVFGFKFAFEFICLLLFKIENSFPFYLFPSPQVWPIFSLSPNLLKSGGAPLSLPAATQQP